MQAGALDRKWSLPEPDLSVLAEWKDDYRKRHPRGDELLLVVEVSDTTAQHDTTTKRDLYARAGVREYWVLDVGGRQLTVHRNLVDGKFAEVKTWSGGETVSPEFHPADAVSVAGLLP